MIALISVLLVTSFVGVLGNHTLMNTESLRTESDILVRKARWLPLIYPRSNPTRLQMIAGFGIPAEGLKVESVITGYVLKAQYYLPYSVKQLRTKDVHEISESRLLQNASIFDKVMQMSEQKLGLDPDMLQEDLQALGSYRWSVYEAFTALAIRMKLNGRVCVLKSICESAAAPFDDRNGLLGEVLHILLTPSSSVDPLAEHSDNDYLQAERLGAAGGDCDQVYPKCPKSLLEHFSDVHHLGSEFLGMLG
ncbi:uncharacterized protein LOC122618098 [Drosophila teissieri]|uniref:uncharacterized protein LOC122618098 n=1 Tax=Drosophila teissieri TaxID=7243 RepID=UPI001CBA3BFD|nr:uncharacterized protein LOC122618098 [Drosophila teissieri]